MLKLCECGCKKETNKGNRFISGHNNRGRKFTKEHRRNMSEAQKGRLITGEHRRRISESKKGFKHSEETKVLYCIIRKGSGNGMYGKKHSEETKKKISLIHKGKTITDDQRRKISKANKGKKQRRGADSPNYGRVVSKETRDKLSIATTNYFNNVENRIKRSCALRGIDIEDWNGFYSEREYCFEFTSDLKDFIKGRDNYECQGIDCWKTSNNLRVHHIDYDKKNCIPENLIALCVSCNTRANFDRDYWEVMYTNIMIRRFL